MSFIDLAKKRYSVRKFTDKPLEDDIVQKILQAGYVAPTGCNNQPQRILVINTKDSIEKLRQCTRCHFGASTAMLVCYNKDECWYRPYDSEPCGPMDASIVTTHMMLQATDLGIGSTWVMHFNPTSIREAFNIPENIIPVALLVMGYPAQDAAPLSGHTDFRPENEIVIYDHF